jgi:hypothetical protein
VAALAVPAEVFLGKLGLVVLITLAGLLVLIVQGGQEEVLQAVQIQAVQVTMVTLGLQRPYLAVTLRAVLAVLAVLAVILLVDQATPAALVVLGLFMMAGVLLGVFVAPALLVLGVRVFLPEIRDLLILGVMGVQAHRGVLVGIQGLLGAAMVEGEGVEARTYLVEEEGAQAMGPQVILVIVEILAIPALIFLEIAYALQRVAVIQ